MYGTRPTRTSTARPNVVPVQATSGGVTPIRSAQVAVDHQTASNSVHLLALLIALYVGWAFLERHEKVREAVQPGNVAVNLRNILMITLTVIIGLTISKIALTKATAVHIPGAATLLKLTEAA